MALQLRELVESIAAESGAPVHEVSVGYEATQGSGEWIWCVRIACTTRDKPKGRKFRFVNSGCAVDLVEAKEQAIGRYLRDPYKSHD